jgi:hypothetical protein
VRLRCAVLTITCAALGAACTDSTGEPVAPGDAAITTLAVGDPARTTTTLPLDVPTTFITSCAQMPAAADLAAIVGIPIADGEVIAAGTCQFLGLNDQSRVVTLGLLTDPVDQATFTDLQLSLGASAPLNDPSLVNAFIDPSSLVYITTAGAIYTVRTLVTDATPAEQVPLSAAILHLWLGV